MASVAINDLPDRRPDSAAPVPNGSATESAPFPWATRNGRHAARETTRQRRVPHRPLARELKLRRLPTRPLGETISRLAPTTRAQSRPRAWTLAGDGATGVQSRAIETESLEELSGTRVAHAPLSWCSLPSACNHSRE